MKTSHLIYALVLLALSGACNEIAGIKAPASKCGNGVVEKEEGEKCDDGNLDDNDKCPTTCLPAKCGDGFVRNGVEECDDGNDDDDDGCRNDCTCPDGAGGAGGAGGSCM